MQRVVYCIAKTRQQVETIVEQLRILGFSNDDISVLLPNRSGTRDFAHEQHTKAPEGASAGGAAGMGIGAILGWLAGIGTIAIPGAGPFIAAGPIMAALGGAAVGGATGGIIGALVGMGIPEYEAKRYAGKLQGGNILVSVHTDDAEERSRAKKIFEQNGGEDIGVGAEAAVEA